MENFSSIKPPYEYLENLFEIYDINESEYNLFISHHDLEWNKIHFNLLTYCSANNLNIYPYLFTYYYFNCNSNLTRLIKFFLKKAEIWEDDYKDKTLLEISEMGAAELVIIIISFQYFFL